MISIIYVTSRKESHFDWFLDGLKLQLQKNPIPVQTILVDFYCDRNYWCACDIEGGVEKISPLPTPYQGKYRITKEDYFAAANAHNSGVVYSKYNYLVFIDDLTVLGEHWLEGIIEATKNKQIVFGAYQKHSEMVVESGKLISSKPDLTGIDNRWDYCGDNDKVLIGAHYLYGCCFGMPTQLYFDLNGMNVACDAMGYEDSEFARRLERMNVQCYYDKRIYTIESVEGHQTGTVMKRIDPALPKEKYLDVLSNFGIGGSSYPPNITYDESHCMVDVTKQYSSLKAWWNYFDLSELRDKIRRGEKITLEDMRYPPTHWFTRELISEM